MDKEYFKKYYQDHKKEFQDRRDKWCIKNPEKAKAIIERYKKKFAGKRKKSINKSKYYKPKKVIPFKKRISPELLAKIEENTMTNNKYIKFFNKQDLVKK